MTCTSYANAAVPYIVLEVASSPSTGWCSTLCRRTALPLRRVRHRQGFRRLLLRLLVDVSRAHRFFLRLFPALCSLVSIFVLAADPRCSCPRILVDFG